MNARRHAFRSLALAAIALSAACGDAAPPGSASEPTATAAEAVDTLAAVTGFGSNPGNLLMYSYVPQSLPSNAPLVVALHGCTEGATDYEDAGWDALADQYGFAVLYPQQQSSNNVEECFNWFGNTSGSTADITRGQGEAASVIQAVDAMKTKYTLDPKRIYATGFSAGAAYAVALLALYPDVFAAGASFSGVPFGCATSLTTAYTCMDSAVTKTPTAWATLAKAGFPGYAGPYPRLSVWQGSSDTTVNTANLGEIVDQWTAVTGVSGTPTTTDTVAGFPHQSFADGSGVVQVESYSITGMSHAVAIDTASSCGTAGTYFVNESVCAVARVAQFFGIVPGGQGGSSGSGSGSSGSSGSGGSNGSSGVGTSSGSGGGGSSGVGGGSSSGTSTAASSGGSVASSSSGAGGAGDAPDAGAAAAAVANMPGCSVAFGATDTPASLALVGLAILALALGRRRARGRAVLGALAAVGVLLAATPARADDEDDTKVPPADDNPVPNEKPAPKHAYLGPQGTFFTGASVSALPAILFGYFPVDHLATTVGLGLTYDANGSPTSPLTGIKGAPNNRVGSDLFLDVIYFVHDRAPFAMGPELNFIGSLSPNYPMTAVVVTPMWALRYAPWKAPVAIGTGLGVGFTFERGMKPMASLATQGLDIVYAF
ncbi:MAG TPA: PHB depolymerase family esterase [Polyangiaceae bacterium]|jgi:poly(hydroxyalkanoate) depolymerase family esterase